MVDKSYALCGTSFGGLIAFMLAHRLRELGQAAPVRLFAAAMPAPERLRVPIIDIADDRLLADLLARSPSPAVPPQAEPAALARRVLGHDLRLAATYRPVQGPPLDCPITVFGGRADPDVHADQLAAWQSHTTAACTTHLLPGGHFFFQESAHLLVTQVVTQITADLRHAPGVTRLFR
jgi:surfactin synthase thioesterase subunit